MEKLLIGILLLSLIGLFTVDKSKWKRTFKSEQWINPGSSEENWQLRWEMIGSLKWNYKLKGMSKQEIKKLLGQPTINNKNSWHYDLGPTGQGINYGTLELTYKNSICQSFRVYQH